MDRYPIDLRLDRNERIASNPELAEALKAFDPARIAQYPDKSRLESILARRFRIDLQCVLVTAGGDDALDRCCRAVLEPGMELLTHAPSFEMIERSARIAGANVTAVEWFDGRFPIDEMLARITTRTRMIAVVSPNNPTGGVVSADDLARLSAAAPDALLVVDLAYTEFAEIDLTEAVRQLPNAVAVRTFSKAWGLAGMRLGYALGPASIISTLRVVGGPYPTSTISLALAEAALTMDDDSSRTYLHVVRLQRERLSRYLTNAGFHVPASQGNFVLLSAGRDDAPCTASALKDQLAQRGIAARGFREPAILRNCLRITLPGDGPAFERLLRALDDILADTSSNTRSVP